MELLIFHPNRKIGELINSSLRVYTNVEAKFISTFEDLLTEIPNSKSTYLICGLNKNFLESNAYKKSKMHFRKFKKIYSIGKLDNSPEKDELAMNLVELPELTEEFYTKDLIKKDFRIIDELKTLIKRFARDFGIDSLKMSKVKVSEFYGLPKLLFTDGVYPIDIFMKSGEDFKLIVPAGEEITQSSLEGTLKEQNELFVYSASRLKIMEYLVETISRELDIKGKSLAEDLESLHTGYNLANLLGNLNLSKETKDITNKLIKSTLKTIAEVKDLRPLLDKILSNKASYRYTKDMITIYLGSHIIDKAEWGDKDQKNKFLHLCLFSDIGLYNDDQAKISGKDELTNSSLSKDLKELVNNHALKSSEIIAKHDAFPYGLETLVKCHHGSPTGVGFDVLVGALTPLNLLFLMCEDFTRAILAADELNVKFDQIKAFDEIKEKYSEHGKFQKYFNELTELSN